MMTLLRWSLPVAARRVPVVRAARCADTAGPACKAGTDYSRARVKGGLSTGGPHPDDGRDFECQCEAQACAAGWVCPALHRRAVPFLAGGRQSPPPDRPPALDGLPRKPSACCNLDAQAAADRDLALARASISFKARLPPPPPPRACALQ